MKFVKYTIIIPVSENEKKELIFYTLDEACDFLKVTHTTFYKILNRTHRFNYKDLEHLKFIKITKEELNTETKNKLKLLYEEKYKKIIYSPQLVKEYEEKKEKGEITII
jgi:hypothetical protein